MSELTDKIQTIRDVQKSMDDEQTKFWENHNDLERQKRELLWEDILQRKSLSEAPWRLELNGSEVYIEAWETTHPKLLEVVDIDGGVLDSYRDPPDKRIHLSFDSHHDEIKIYQNKTADDLISFMEENNITVDVSNIKNHVLTEMAELGKVLEIITRFEKVKGSEDKNG